MSKQPLVTIMVVTYKSFDDIYTTLDSAFSLTYPRLELIFQDDGSPNWAEYEEAITAYIDAHKTPNYEQVRMNHLTENVGTTRNVNAGLAITEGKYVINISGDDAFCSPDVIEQCVEYCEAHDARILCGQSYVIRRGETVAHHVEDEIENTMSYRLRARSGRLCNYAPPTNDVRYLSKLGETNLRKCNQILASRCIISTASVFYRTDLFRETGGYLTDYRLIEDMTYWPHIAKLGEHIHFAEIPMQKYALGGISNDGELNDTFFEWYKEIMNGIYIANEFRGGPFNKLVKAERSRGIKWMEVCRGRVTTADRLKYLDAVIVKFIKDVKYLVCGSKL